MDEVINYVMNTPGNTNPNILRGMLENSSNGPSGSGLVVHADIDETDPENTIYTLDKTGQEILDAYPWVKCVYNHTVLNETTYYILDLVRYEVFNALDGTVRYSFIFEANEKGFTVFATNLNDYPTNQIPEQEDPGGTGAVM